MKHDDNESLKPLTNQQAQRITERQCKEQERLSPADGPDFCKCVKYTENKTQLRDFVDSDND